MTRDTIYALLAIGVAVVAGILVGLGFIAVTSIFYSLHYGAC
jgi:RsiW-degrading membrane proteinase PrsW (M82 family)